MLREVCVELQPNQLWFGTLAFVEPRSNIWKKNTNAHQKRRRTCIWLLWTRAVKVKRDGNKMVWMLAANALHLRGWSGSQIVLPGRCIKTSKHKHDSNLILRFLIRFIHISTRSSDIFRHLQTSQFIWIPCSRCRADFNNHSPWDLPRRSHRNDGRSTPANNTWDWFEMSATLRLCSAGISKWRHIRS